MRIISGCVAAGALLAFSNAASPYDATSYTHVLRTKRLPCKVTALKEGGTQSSCPPMDAKVYSEPDESKPLLSTHPLDSGPLSISFNGADALGYTSAFGGDAGNERTVLVFAVKGDWFQIGTRSYEPWNGRLIWIRRGPWTGESEPRAALARERQESVLTMSQNELGGSSGAVAAPSTAARPVQASAAPAPNPYKDFNNSPSLKITIEKIKSCLKARSPMCLQQFISPEMHFPEKSDFRCSTVGTGAPGDELRIKPEEFSQCAFTSSSKAHCGLTSVSLEEALNACFLGIPPLFQDDASGALLGPPPANFGCRLFRQNGKVVLASVPCIDNPNEKLIGLVEIPGIFGKSDPKAPPGQTLPGKPIPLKLFAEPRQGAKVALEVDRTGVISREHGYEERSAVVLERKEGWYLIKKAAGGSAWLSPQDAGRFYSYENLMGGLAYFTRSWNNRLHKTPEPDGPYETTGPYQTDGPYYADWEDSKAEVNVLESKVIKGRLWLHVQIVEGRCEGEEKLGKKGWVPGYDNAGKLNFWFHSRGC